MKAKETEIKFVLLSVASIFWWKLNVRTAPGIQIFAEAVSEIDEWSTEEDRYQPSLRDRPCYDLDLHCGDWARAGECRLNAAFEYMWDNCKLSCNFCDLHLKTWTPQGGDIMALDYNGVQIFTGTSQQLNFQDSPMNTDSEQKSQYMKQRMYQIIEAQERYMQSIYENRFINRGSYEAKYSALNLDDCPSGEALPLVETCFNRHTHCTLWAAKGFCDSKPYSMSEVCPLVCQVCEWNMKLDKSILTTPREQDGSWMKNPFKRMDLFGLIESIYENRMVLAQKYVALAKHSPVATLFVLTHDGGKEVPLLDNESMGVTTNYDPNKPEERKIIRFENFLTTEECHSILNTVKFGVGVDTSSGLGGGADGFPHATTDKALDDEGNEYILRKSSRVFLYPSLRDDTTNTQKFAPAIQVILHKITFLFGIPSYGHIESPIQFDKFNEGEFQGSVGHFEEAILTEEGNILIDRLSKMQLNEEQDVGKDQISQVIKETLPVPNLADDESSTSSKQKVMENARVFGLTIFLNTGEDGGEIVFPNLNNHTVIPMRGSAVLFPVVTNLTGETGEENIAIDREYSHNGKDHSYLKEDLSTLIVHNPVTDGLKYSVTLYIRRYER